MVIILIGPNFRSNLRDEWLGICAMSRSRRYKEAERWIRHIKKLHAIELWPPAFVDMLFNLKDVRDKYAEIRKLVMFFIGNMFPVKSLTMILLFRVALGENSHLDAENQIDALQLIKDVNKICKLISQQGDRMYYYDIQTGERRHIFRSNYVIN